MKNWIAFLLSGLTVALASCGDDKSDERQWFRTPEARVEGTTVLVTCRSTFGEGALENVGAGFAYAAFGSDGLGPSVDAAAAREGDRLVGTLEGLSPRTTYVVYAYADLPTGRVRSAAATFETGLAEESPDPGPDPDPAPGETRYAGWPELPVEVNDPDYRYAYHICPDFSVDGHKARNYTVCFSVGNHCPVWVAAPRHTCYEMKGTNRTDAYGRDPLIEASVQYRSKATGGGCNKGHMLGSAERLVTRATNEQVFYYTNIAPQYSSNFNTGGGAWNELEEFVDRQVCPDTTYIVAGTWFEPFTDAYGKSCSPARISFGGRSDVTRPSMFYYLVLRTRSGSTRKSVRECRADELKCAAFVLRHNIEKGHEPQAADMMTVAEVEALTGFRFFSNVPNAPKDRFDPADWGL